MRLLYHFLLIISSITLSASAQERSISEYDLYGCWIMERAEKGQQPDQLYYSPCDSSNPDLRIKSSQMELQAYNQCEFQALIFSPMNCNGRTETLQGTWSYDENTGVLTIYYPEDYLAEYYELLKEDFPEKEFPIPRVKETFRITNIKNGKLIIDKTTPNNGYEP